MQGLKERLKGLRLKAGLDPESLADQIGISTDWYLDLENEDGQVEETLDLEQIRKLALQLEVGLAQLLTGAPLPPGTPALTFTELARAVRRRLEDETSLDDLEEKAGWELGALLKHPEQEGWGHHVPFFRDLCTALGLDWLGILAYAEALPEA